MFDFYSPYFEFDSVVFCKDCGSALIQKSYDMGYDRKTGIKDIRPSKECPRRHERLIRVGEK